MSVPAVNGVPCTIQAGNTVIFTESFADYPPSAWAATIYISLNGGTVTSVAATESGDPYTFTLSAAVTAALAYGANTFTIRVTDGTDVAEAKSGFINVLPNPTVAQTASIAQQMLTALDATILALCASGNATVSFNNQSYTKRNLTELRALRTELQAEVIAERRAALRASGVRGQSTYAATFGGGGNNPYPGCGCH